MSIVNPTNVFEVTVVTPQALARGSLIRGTIDLTASYGMFLHALIDRADTTALGTGVAVQVRCVLGGASGTRIHPNAGQSRLPRSPSHRIRSPWLATSSRSSGRTITDYPPVGQSELVDRT